MRAGPETLNPLKSRIEALKSDHKAKLHSQGDVVSRLAGRSPQKSTASNGVGFKSRVSSF